MPQDRLVSFNGGTHTSNTAPAPSSLVDRDSNGLAQSVAFASSSGGYISNQGALFEAGAAFSALATLTNTSPKFCECDATSASFNLTLPPASTSSGQVFELSKIDSSGHAAGFAPSGSDNINGANTPVTTSTQWANVKVRCNQAGTAWYTF